MDIKQLEVFVAVAKHKSFSKAARELFLTQPTVSSHIQNLENEMQTVLLNRNNKTITLTDSGHILYNHAIVILNDCKKAVYDIKEYSGKIEGSISIVCSSVPEAHLFPSFLNKFCEKYPNITFTINHCNSNLVIPEILSERATFGIVGSKQKHPHIDYYDLINDELVLICPPDCEIENDNGYIDIEKLKDLTFIMRKEGSGTRNVIIKKLNASPVPPSALKIRAYVESNHAIVEMVRNGLGCSFVSEISARYLIDRGELKEYRIKNHPFDRNFYFIFSKKKVFTPTEKKFIEYLKDFYDLDIDLQIFSS
nr:selenium metabolism-associated LysR family transcriptional regulator [uncultured Peptostreptococcus sp.]